MLNLNCSGEKKLKFSESDFKKSNFEVGFKDPYNPAQLPIKERFLFKMLKLSKWV